MPYTLQQRVRELRIPITCEYYYALRRSPAQRALEVWSIWMSELSVMVVKRWTAVPLLILSWLCVNNCLQVYTETHWRPWPIDLSAHHENTIQQINYTNRNGVATVNDSAYEIEKSISRLSSYAQLIW